MPRALQLSAATVHEVLRKHQSLVVESLDAGLNSECSEDTTGGKRNGESLEKLSGHSLSLEAVVDDKLLVDTFLPLLSTLEQTAVRLFFYDDLSRTEIARTLDISINYAGHLVKQGVQHLLQMIEGQPPSEIGKVRKPLKVRRATMENLQAMVSVQATQKVNGKLADNRAETASSNDKAAVADDIATTRQQMELRHKAAACLALAKSSLPVEQQITVPPSYRNNIAAFPDLKVLLKEEVRRVAVAACQCDP